MAWVKRTFACQWCGVIVTRKIQNGSVRQCYACGLERMVSSVHQMNARSGPAWEAFQASRGAQGRPRKTD